MGRECLFVVHERTRPCNVTIHHSLMQSDWIVSKHMCFYTCRDICEKANLFYLHSMDRAATLDLQKTKGPFPHESWTHANWQLAALTFTSGFSVFGILAVLPRVAPLPFVDVPQYQFFPHECLDFSPASLCMPEYCCGPSPNPCCGSWERACPIPLLYR